MGPPAEIRGLGSGNAAAARIILPHQHHVLFQLAVEVDAGNAVVVEIGVPERFRKAFPVDPVSGDGRSQDTAHAFGVRLEQPDIGEAGGLVPLLGRSVGIDEDVTVDSGQSVEGNQIVVPASLELQHSHGDPFPVQAVLGLGIAHSGASSVRSQFQAAVRGHHCAVSYGPAAAIPETVTAILVEHRLGPDAASFPRFLRFEPGTDQPSLLDADLHATGGPYSPGSSGSFGDVHGGLVVVAHFGDQLPIVLVHVGQIDGENGVSGIHLGPIGEDMRHHRRGVRLGQGYSP